MARVTHIKSARQRYEMVPVLDDEGNPKRTVVMMTRKVFNSETKEYETVTEPKKTKHGREVTMAVTVVDKSKPLPNLHCDYPGCDIDGGEILPGTSYKHITPRSGPYGGTQKNRHAAHPDWNVWEYSYSRAAQVARTQSEMHDAISAWEPDTEEDFDSLRDELAGMAQEALDEAQEAVDNMPEQLQDGSQAQMNAEALESWVSEIESASPDSSATFEDCDNCNGTGEVSEDCENCAGTGTVEGEDGEEEECFECDAQGTLDDSCDQCGGSGETDVLSEDWIDDARETLSNAVDSVEI